MKTRDEILRDNPLADYLRKIGVPLRGSGDQLHSNRCANKQHKNDHWCVDVNVSKQIWTCHDCKGGGSIIDWLMVERGQDVATVLKSLDGSVNAPRRVWPSRPLPLPSESATMAPGPRQAPRIVAAYDYLNESHELVYQAVRLEPKSFRQRHPDGKGNWIWTMEGITRILFNLPNVLLAKTVCIAEGEKDCQTLNGAGHVATCNVGGAGKWAKAYSERLKGKDVVIFPDNDEPGRKHADDIVESLDGLANSVKVVIIPEPHKDVTEFVESFSDKERAFKELAALIEKTGHRVKPIPIYTIEEMEREYTQFLKRIAGKTLDLGKMLPQLGANIEPLVPGELLLFLANTGVGKTLLVSNLLRSISPLQSLLFELELPLTKVFERFTQMEVGCYASDVKEEYLEANAPLWKAYRGLHHIAVCPESGLSTDQIESLIEKSELKLGTRPVVVAVDYIGLLNTRNSKSRYERMSDAAEQMKIIAKRTGTIMVLSSQVARPDKSKESLEIGLHDGKDSGALENSAGVVIGCWRPERDKMMLKILKNTSGQSGAVIEAFVDGAKMQIKPTRSRYVDNGNPASD